jgi:hypothetical protein
LIDGSHAFDLSVDRYRLAWIFYISRLTSTATPQPNIIRRPMVPTKEMSSGPLGSAIRRSSSAMEYLIQFDLIHSRRVGMRMAPMMTHGCRIALPQSWR